ncbi:matrix metalloproteinase-14-like [Watersipora subatra]|uniref:matrix metalloproteinase-14-like n=1 Tax=Watersipora subatra TaxID=2589382 RepID=UPI00355B997F
MFLLKLAFGIVFLTLTIAVQDSNYKHCIEYLIKHGWMDSHGLQSNSMKNMSEQRARNLTKFVKDPIRQMQSYHKIEQTGLCNNATLEFMRSWKCAETSTRGMSKKNINRGKRWAALYDIPLWNNPVNGIPFPLTIGFKNYHPNMTEADQDEALLHCATMWAEASAISFSFSRHQLTANIFISFLESIEGDDGQGGVLATAESPTPFRNPPQSNIQFDAREPWVAKWTPDQPAKTKSFQAVLCHEIGHSLALGHSRVRTALMFGELLSRQQEAALDQDDRNGIEALYGPPNGLVIVNATSTTTSAPSLEDSMTDEQTSRISSTTLLPSADRPSRCTNGRRKLQRRNCSSSRWRSRS